MAIISSSEGYKVLVHHPYDNVYLPGSISTMQFLIVNYLRSWVQVVFWCIHLNNEMLTSIETSIRNLWVFNDD